MNSHEKGKWLILSITICIIFLELLKVLLFGSVFIQLQDILQKCFIVIIILFDVLFVVKGFNWAKWVLGLLCFFFGILLLPVVLINLWSHSVFSSKELIFNLIITLTVIVYFVMGFIIISSRSISNFIIYQKSRSNWRL